MPPARGRATRALRAARARTSSSPGRASGAVLGERRLQEGARRPAHQSGASEPASDDTCDTVDIARLQATAKQNPRGIELLGPPPFKKVGGQDG